MGIRINMEASNSLADSMILDYLRKNCRYAVVKAFAKEKNIDLEKENEASANIKDILDAYKTVQKTKTEESKFVTSTPKPAVSKKPTDSSHRHPMIPMMKLIQTIKKEV